MKNVKYFHMNKDSAIKAIAFNGLMFFMIFLFTGCNPPAGKKQDDKNLNDRNDAWSLTGFGGGGAMFFPAVSPHSTDYAMAACDMTG
jgi:hypothetical protein